MNFIFHKESDRSDYLYISVIWYKIKPFSQSNQNSFLLLMIHFCHGYVQMYKYINIYCIKRKPKQGNSLNISNLLLNDSLWKDTRNDTHKLRDDAFK